VVDSHASQTRPPRAKAQGSRHRSSSASFTLHASRLPHINVHHHNHHTSEQTSRSAKSALQPSTWRTVVGRLVGLPTTRTVFSSTRWMRVGHSATRHAISYLSNSQLALEQHECASSPTASDYCPCDRSFSTKEALQQHECQSRQQEHDTPEPKANIEDVSRLFERTSLHHPPSTEETLQQHERNLPAHLTTLDHQQHECDSPAHQATINCKYCDGSFPTMKALHQHRCPLPTHRNKSSRERSNRLSSTELAFQQHERDLSASQATIGCKYCPGSFSTLNALHQHRCGLPTREVTPDLEPSRQTTPSENDSPATSFAFDRSFPDHPHQHERDSPAHASVKPWSLQPAKHEEVLELIHPVLSVEFFKANGFDDCTRHHDTHIMGYFTCSNKACPKDMWSSKMIALTIRLYSGKRCNAVVWHQRCKKCQSFGEPELEESYAERIAYRLKVWFIKPYEKIDYLPGDPFPHKRHLCEGCKNGHCPIDQWDKS
jgi:hypothetical protein